MSSESAAPATAPRVVVLPSLVADQIAAGAVVERPASVVKELVENALDAGATRIEVELEVGGRECIRVRDDGSGMAPEDAVLALRRHATSKLRVLDDLQTIGTLGFRGEALASIAAVGRVVLVTRERGREAGVRLEVDDAGRIESRPEGAPYGTTIEVAALFGRVPARRKFLRSPQTELAHVTDWFGRLALAHPETGFFLRHGGREVLGCPAVTRHEERLEQVLGSERARTLIPFAHEEGRVRVHGWTSRAGQSFPSAKQISTWVRARSVRDRVLLRAIGDAYRALLPQGRHPVVIAFVDLPGTLVDVNVHPMKTEVRFASADEVYTCLLRGLRAALDAAAGPPVSAAGEGDEESGRGAAFENRIGAAMARYAERPPGGGSNGVWRVAPGAESAGRSRPGARPDGDDLLARDAPSGEDGFARAPALTGAAGAWSGTDPFPAAVGEVVKNRSAASQAELLEVGAGTPATQPEGGAPRFRDLRVVGQALRGWIVCESGTGLVLVDQHAAHERIRFERLRAQATTRLPGQALLVPRVVELDAAAVAALLEQRDAVVAAGFDVEAFGEGAVIVRTLPAALDVGCDAEGLLAELAGDLGEIGASERADAARDLLLARVACHGAVRLGDTLELREMQALVAELDTIPFAATCPHGRPLLAELSRAEIERRVRR